MSQAEYAARRDEIMAANGGPRPSSEWMGGVDLPAPRAGLTDAEMAQLMPWRHQGERPTAGRPLDYETARVARAAAASTSLAVPNRYTNPNGANNV